MAWSRARDSATWKMAARKSAPSAQLFLSTRCEIFVAVRPLWKPSKKWSYMSDELKRFNSLWMYSGISIPSYIDIDVLYLFVCLARNPLSSARFTQIQHVAPDLQVTFSTSVDPSCSSFRIFGLTLTNIFWQGGSWRYLKPPKVNSLGALKSAENAASHGNEPLPKPPPSLCFGSRSGPAVLLRRETIAGEVFF